MHSQSQMRDGMKSGVRCVLFWLSVIFGRSVFSSEWVLSLTQFCIITYRNCWELFTSKKYLTQIECIFGSVWMNLGFNYEESKIEMKINIDGWKLNWAVFLAILRKCWVRRWSPKLGSKSSSRSGVAKCVPLRSTAVVEGTQCVGCLVVY
jgi:hypothetical protein